MTAITATAALLAFPAMLFAAAATDLRRYIIPDWTSIGLLIGFATAYLAVGAPEGLPTHLVIGGVAFLIGFGLFHFNYWGGGDAKLFAATALWFDWPNIAYFVAYTAIGGALLTLVTLVICTQQARLRAVPALAAIDFERRKTHSPYGVALALGALLTFPHTPLFAALLVAVIG